MGFLNPVGFLGFLLAIPIIAVYLLRLHYRDYYVVPSLLLWQAVLQDRYASQPWQKLKKHWLLILQLFTLLLLVLSLAQPVVPGVGQSADHVFILLDISASMLAQNSQDITRLQTAVEQLREVISDSLSSNSITLIAVGRQPYILLQQAGKHSILNALGEIVAEHGTADWPAALRLVQNMARNAGDHDVLSIIASDFAFAPDDAEFMYPGKLSVINVGDASPNAGIVHLSARRIDQDVSAFIRLQNMGSPAERNLDILADGVLYERRHISLPRNGQVVVTVDSIPAQAWVEVKLLESDNFTVDDCAWVVLESAGPQKILLVTSGNRFLSTALSHLSSVDFQQTTELLENSQIDDTYAAYVIDAAPVSYLPRANMWLIAPEGDTLCGTQQEVFFHPGYTDGQWQHPIMHYVDWSEVYIEVARIYQIPDSAEVLLWSSSNPLLWVNESGGNRVVCTAFKLQDSDLPLRLAFPILASNIMDWLGRFTTSEPQTTLQPGDLWYPIFPANTTSAALTDPTNNVSVVPVDGSPIILKHVGLYTFRATTPSGVTTQNVSVSLLNPEESNLSSRSSLSGSAVTNLQVRTEMDITTWMAGLALLTCLVEAFMWWRWAYGDLRTSFSKQGYRDGRVFEFVLRLVILVCLCGVLFGVRFRAPNREKGFVFVVDRSESTRTSWEAQERFVREAFKRKAPHDQAAIVLFGREPWIEQSLSTTDSLPELTTELASDATNIENAIVLATTLLPRDMGGRIILLSDGLETDGDAQEAIDSAVAMGLDIQMVQTGSGVPSAEVWIDKIEFPAAVYPGDIVPINVNLATNTPQTVKINWSVGNDTGSAFFDITKNGTVFQFTSKTEATGFFPVRVCVEPILDTYIENNCSGSWLVVKGTPQILVVSSGSESDQLVSAIRANGIDVDVISPSGLPQSIEALAEYKALIIVNIPGREFTQQALSVINQYVSDIGGGLLTIGGLQSYGVGGWLGTQLEKALPVDMRVQDPQRFPPIVVALIIDTSGSMADEEGGMAKIRIASEAALRVIEAMNSGDRLLVVGYGDSLSHLTGPSEITGESSNVKQQILTLSAGGGGIFVYESLDYALKLLVELPVHTSEARHVLLIADGGDAEHQQGVLNLVEQATNLGITVSSITIGPGDDVAFLRSLAENGQGKFYLAANALDLPAIFTEEVARVKRSYIVEAPFTPQSALTWEPFNGILPYPTLSGYVVTSPKPRAETILTAGEGDPLLSIWQYGLGRSAAWTSDATSHWATNWISWQDYAAFWNAVIRDVMLPETDADIDVQIREDGGRTVIYVDVSHEDDFQEDSLELALRFSGEASDTDVTVEMEQDAPGRYRAKVTGLQNESYLIRLYGDRSTVFGWTPPPAKEFLPAKVESAMATLAAQSGVTLIQDVDEVFNWDMSRVAEKVTVTLPLLWASAILWACSVVWRRLNLSWVRIINVVSKRIRGGIPNVRRYRKGAPIRERSDVAVLQAQKRKLIAPSQEKVGYTRNDDAFLSESVIDRTPVELAEADKLEEDINLAARLRKRLREKDDEFNAS